MGENQSTSLPWSRVGLAILPGLTALFLHSNIAAYLDMNTQGPSVYQALPVVSALLLLAEYWRQRRMTLWMFPSVGVFTCLFAWLIMDLLFPSSGPPPPIHSFLANLWPVVGWGLSIAIVWKFRSQITLPSKGWWLVGLVVVIGVVQDGSALMLVTMGDMLLSFALGLILARHHGLAAGMVMIAGMYGWVDLIFDPSYYVPGVYGTLIEMTLIFGFLILPPIWVMRSCSPNSSAAGLLIPPAVALIGGEILRSLTYPFVYDAETWLIRGLTVVQLMLLIGLAVLLFQPNTPQADRMPSGRLIRIG